MYKHDYDLSGNDKVYGDLSELIKMRDYCKEKIQYYESLILTAGIPLPPHSNEKLEEFKKQLSGYEIILNDVYSGFTSSPFYIKTEMKNKIEVHSDNEQENIELALLEAIWISRWTTNKQALVAILEPEEAQKIVKDIFVELDKIGYEIKKKI